MTVYAIFGHGCDIIPREGEPRLTVPRGCTYVTIVLCGFLSDYLFKLAYALKDPYIEEALKDPNTHVAKLNAYFTKDNADDLFNPIIHIHNEGDEYLDSINTLIYDTGNGYFKSGIYTLGNIPSMYKHREIRNGNDFTNSLFTKTLTPESVRAMYDGSLIRPDVTRINSMDSLKAEMVKVAGDKPRLSHLFEGAPGIYYNFACRPSCDKTMQGVTSEERNRSASREFKSGRMAALGNNMRPPMPIPDNIDTQLRLHSSTILNRHRHFNEWYMLREGVKGDFIRSMHRRLSRNALLRNTRSKGISASKAARAARNTSRRGVRRFPFSPKSGKTRSRR